MNKAKWIWLSEGKRDEYAEFVFDFKVENASDVFMDVSVFGDYALYINGQIVAFGQYADYIDYKVYDTIDLSKHLSVGVNKARLVCWHIGESSSVYKEAGAGVIFEIYRGDKVLAYSSEKTKCALAKDYVSFNCKLITAQLGYSYTYDTRFENVENEYKNAIAINLTTKLYKRPNKKTELKRLTQAVLIDKDKKLYDLGRECCGFLDISFKAKDGEKIQVGFGEHIDDGDVRHYIYGRDFTVDLIGNGRKTDFLGAFRRLGCRYLKIIGDAEVYSIGVREVVYPLTVKPFEIQDERRKEIYLTSLKTLELCMHEHYEDCPWREQAMYIMDSRNQMRCGYYAFDNLEFPLSAIRLMAKGQKENGLFDLCFPSDINITIPSFSLTFPAVVYEYAVQSKSNQIVIEMMPSIDKMMAYFLDDLKDNGLFKTVSADGLWHFYEWAGDLDNAIYNPHMVKNHYDDYDVLINAFISIACEYCSKLCALTMDFERSIKFIEIKKQINEAIFKTFFVEQTGLFKTRVQDQTYSALANALCILADACDKKRQIFIADKLANGYDWVENTLSMNIFRFDALIKVDKAKYRETILNEIDKVYGYMLDNGATSFWETIKGASDFGLAGSLCHGWSAIPVYYYRVLGVTKVPEKTIDEVLEFRNLDLRTDYVSSVQDFIDHSSKSCQLRRDKLLYSSEKTKRKELVKLLGYPLADKEKWKANLVRRQLLFTNEYYSATKYVFDVNGLAFWGILYEKPNAKPITKNDALLLAFHGGGGSPEIVGDLFIDSANYNNMIRRTVKDGIRVFAPQLLLWNVEAYGSSYDREILNRRLVQLGGSVTALELKLLSSIIDFWSNSFDENKLAVLGLSYGGMYSLHLGALDSRLKAVYSSCWFSDRAKHNWHDWTYFNAQNKFFDSEVASLVLPRRLFIEVGANDQAFPASDAEKEKDRLLSYARKTKQLDNLSFKIFDGEHELDKNNELLNEFLEYILK